MKRLLAVLILICLPAFSEQIVINVPCEDGEANTERLRKYLSMGYEVISAVPVLASGREILFSSSTKPTHTKNIVYILSKPDQVEKPK